jgi:hypothetical protein
VAFIKVLTMNQIYHTWIHPFHHSPLSPFPQSWSRFNRHHFCIHIHVYTFFVPYATFYPLPLSPPPPIGTIPYWGWRRGGRSCSALFWFCKRRIKKMMFLLIWDKGFNTGSFLVTFPWMYVLYPQLVHLLYFNSFCLTPFSWWFQPVLLSASWPCFLCLCCPPVHICFP